MTVSGGAQGCAGEVLLRRTERDWTARPAERSIPTSDRRSPAVERRVDRRPGGAPRRPTTLTDRWSRWTPWAVFAAGLVVFGWRVGSPSPWRDEAATLAICRRSLPQMWAVVQHIDAVHFVFYLLAHVALSVHDSVTSVRLISVLAMAGAAGLLVPVGRMLGDRSVGGLAGVLLVASPWASRWAQDARPFALVTLAAVVSTLALLVACRDSGTARSRRRWVGYAASLILLTVLNVLALLLVTAHLAVLLATAPRRVRGRWLLACAGAGLAVAPFLVVAFGQRDQVSWIPRPRPYDLLVVFLLPFGSRFVFPLLTVVLIGVAGLLAVLGRPPGGAARARLVLAASWAVLPPVLLWSVSQLIPLWDAHYVLFALPGLALLAACLPRVLLARLREAARGRYAATPTGWVRRLPAVAAGVLVGAVVLLGLPAQLDYRAAATGHAEDIRGVATYVSDHARPGDAVLYAPEKLRVIAASYPDRMARLDDVALARTPVSSGTLHGVDVPASALPARLDRHDRVWVVHGAYVTQRPVSQAAVDLTALGYRDRGDTRLAGYVVTLYQRF